ncbi:MAG TPA: ABC transporter permease subunit, partial [Clostridiaceae bacterium]|nr:ABC transporter permease subunit [Clostridiaceae bacterium]
MQRYLAGTRNELDKLLLKKKYYVFLIIEIAICVIMILLDKLLSRVSGGVLTFGGADLSLMMLTFFIRVYIPLIIFMATCDLFSSEFSDLTARAVLIRPVTRLKAYLSKITAIMLLGLMFLAMLLIATVALEGFSRGGIRSFWLSFGAYLLDAVPLFVLLLMAVFVNQLTKSSSLAMFLLILIYALLTIVGILVPQLSGLLFTGYSQWHNLWIGETIPFKPMLAKIGLLAGYATIF